MEGQPRSVPRPSSERAGTLIVTSAPIRLHHDFMGAELVGRLWALDCWSAVTTCGLMKQYTITARAKASAAFPRGQALGMNYDLGDRQLHLEMHTRRKGEEGAFLGDLQVTARTAARSVEEAAALVTRGREMAIMVSLAANAAIHPLEAELVYETTPGVEEREYFQRFVPEDEMSYADRVVPIDETAGLLSLIASHEQRDRLIRAISQYSEALLRWEHGNELLVLAHLFMGVEAIKKACWRGEITRRGITKEELACEWGFSADGRVRIDDFLDRSARLRLVFKDDAKHHRIAKEVSDSFEHGFANAGTLFKPAASALVPTAAYLREAIFNLLELPDEHREVLLSDTYKYPKGPAGIEQYFRALLIGPPDARLAAEGQDHPYCIWQIEVEARQEEDGSRVYEHKPSMTPVIGQGIMLRPLNHEVWARGTFKPKSAAETEGTRPAAAP